MQQATGIGRRPGWFVRKIRRARRVRRTGREIFREEGLVRLLARTAVVVAGAVYRHVVFFSLDLARPVPEITTDVPVEFRFLRFEDGDAYGQFRADPAHVILCLRRLEKGDHCVAAWLDDEIVSAGWFSVGTGYIAEIGRPMRLALDEVYLFDSYTVARLRGRNIASARARWVAAYLHDAGYRRTISFVSPKNRRGFGPPYKAGYQRLGIGGFVRLGLWRRDFVQPLGGTRRWARRRQPIEFERDFPSHSRESAASQPSTRQRVA